MGNNTIHDVITVTIGGGEWTLHRCGGRRYGFSPDLAGITFGRAFIDAARRAIRGPATPITQDVTIDGERVILTSVEVIVTSPGPRVFALAWEPVSRPKPADVAITINGDGAGIGAAFAAWYAEAIGARAVMASTAPTPLEPRLSAEREARRAREQPLVALVAAVPEGLDPVGWRAAVLTYAENYRAPWWRADEVAKIADELALTVQGRARHDGDAAVIAAYCRAVAPPGRRPTPERKVGGRAVRLVLDA